MISVNKKQQTTILLILIQLSLFQVTEVNAQNTVEIHIQNNRFVPNEVNIEIGDIVKFVWDAGASGHNVAQASSSSSTKYNGDGFKSPTQNGLAEWTLPSEFTQTNVTLYFLCEPHVASHGMRGKIIVGAGSAEIEEGINRSLFWGVIIGIFIAGTGIFVIMVKRSNSSV